MQRLFVGGRSTIGAARFGSYLLRNISSKSASSLEPVATTAPPPWLMLPSKLDDNGKDNYQLLSIADKKVTKVEKKLGIPWRKYHLYPEADTVYLGSPGYGWQALGNKKNGKLLLFNPLGNPLEFSHTIIPLPPLESTYFCFSSFHKQKLISDTPTTEFLDVDTEYHIVRRDSPITPEYVYKYWLSKLVLSVPPLSSTAGGEEDHCLTYNEDCLLMAKTSMYGPCRFICCRPGDTSWTSLKKSVGKECGVFDFTYFSSHKLFYSLTYDGVLESWDPRRHMQSIVYDCFPPATQPTMDEHQIQVRRSGSRNYHLVDSSGDLLLVVRYSESKRFDGKGEEITKNFYWNGEKYVKIERNRAEIKRQVFSLAFDVYKLDFVNKKWVYVPHLGDDRVLFLGLNSFSISLSDNPGSQQGSLTGNCIYFSFGKDDFKSTDSGVYNLKDGSITAFLPECFSSPENQFPSSSPMWIHPQH